MAQSDSGSGSNFLSNEYMRRALQLAELGWGQTAPNPMVGAVVVSSSGDGGGGGEIVGEGYHARYGGEHAEVVAIKAAGDKALGATIYVTLEPCNHYGKTPPCTKVIIDAGIARAVYATRDPNLIAQGGLETLRTAGIEVKIEPDNDVIEAARELNAAFFHSFESELPFVILKLAMSADGAIAPANRERTWITGELARAESHRLRAGVDAIAVGVGTVIDDDPLLTARHVPLPRKQPLRVIFDRGGRTPPDSQLLRTATEEEPVLILSNPSIEGALRELKARGINSLLVEGGAELAQSFRPVAARLIIFQSPVNLGPGALKPNLDFSGLRVVRRAAFGQDTMTVYAFNK